MNPADEARYARQIKLPQIGEAGQEAITQATILIVGMGGLGSPAALYLAAAGVGCLRLTDFDVVEESNLQRQVIHGQASLGQLKTHSARERLQQLNPQCKVTTIDHELSGDELKDHITAADVVLDCSDNFETRFAINRLCVATGTPLVSAAAIRLEGQIMNVIPALDGPCYQCLYSEQYENAPTCESEGVLGPVVGVMGTLQALNALLILTGHTEQLVGRLTLFDGLNMEWRQIKVPKNPGCPVCSA